jgi:rhamnose transport system substrate-binding protein
MRKTRTTTIAAGIGLALALTKTACGEGSGGSASSGDSGGSGASGSGGGGGDYTVAFVPKLQGIPYFEAMNSGGQAACEEIGCKWLYQGPVEADPAAQADIVRSYIQQGVDSLIVAPNDPDSMAPLLKQAADAGIKVATADTDAPNSVRQVFVSQASTEGIGQALTDALLGAMGGKGKYAIVSCGQTAQNLNSWIEVQKAYTAQKYPDAQIVDIFYAGEDQAAATQMATDLMNAHPDLTGLVGECTSSAPGVAQAIRDAGKIGKVFSVGLGTPKSMQPYLADGSSSASILWDVENLGYLTAWTGVQLASGKELQPTNDVSSDITGVTYDPSTKVLLLGPPLTITKDNAGDYDY